MLLRALLTGLPTLVLCVALAGAVRQPCVAGYERLQARVANRRWRSVWVLSVVMMLMLLGNFLQMAMWALLFLMLGEFADYCHGALPLGGELHHARLRRHRDVGALAPAGRARGGERDPDVRRVHRGDDGRGDRDAETRGEGSERESRSESADPVIGLRRLHAPRHAMPGKAHHRHREGAGQRELQQPHQPQRQGARPCAMAEPKMISIALHAIT